MKGKLMNRIWRASALCVAASTFQLAGCFGEITTTSTVSGRDFFLNGLRGLILAPLDALLVQVVDNLFEEDVP